MSVSEDRISHIAHMIVERVWRDDLADLVDERRALECVKGTLTTYFHISEEIDEAVRTKMKSKVPGSREWEILYSKYFQEELTRRKF